MQEKLRFKPFVESKEQQNRQDKTDYLSNCLCNSINFDNYPIENQFKAIFDIQIDSIEYNAELIYSPSGVNVLYLFDNETGEDVLEFKKVPFIYNKKKLKKEVETFIYNEIDSIENEVNDRDQFDF